MTAGTLVASTGFSADIDLYQTNDSGSGGVPNILLLMDTSANWNQDIGGIKQKDLEFDAFAEVFSDTSLEGRIRLGFSTFAKKQNEGKGSKIVEAVKPLDSAYRTHLVDLFQQGDSSDRIDQTNNAPYALTMEETLRYYASEMPRSGTQDGNHDPAAIDNGVEDDHDGDGSEDDDDADNDDGDDYISPASVACGKNYAVWIANGAPDSGEDREAERVLESRDGILDNDPINLEPKNFESNWADEYARFMSGREIVPDAIRDGNQNVITYVIDVHEKKNNETRKEEASHAFLKSIAQQGDGRYFAAHSKADIVAALEKIFDELLAVNTVFAATALPVSVNVRGTNLNQVYMGVFRPDQQDRPRWFGNLKLYQLEVDSSTGELFLADSNGDPAQSKSTGFIVSGASSFWTHDSDFWSFDPRGNPPTASDDPDGAVVEKGGVAQKMRDLEDDTAYADQRNVYTCHENCTSGSSLSAHPFAASSGISASDLNVDTTSERDAVIDWVRGEDNAVDEDADGRTDDVRASIHGDVLHSTPAVVNYDGDQEIVAYYGTNDGAIRAVRGGKGDGTATSSSGKELWSFVPEEFFPRLKLLRDNDTTGKEYFADGDVTVYSNDANDDGDLNDADDSAILIASMRRGGRFLYALDVSDPLDPKLLWQRDFQDTDYGELGYTWSSPDVGEISATTDPVAIFGAGYDPDADDPGTSGTRSMGRGMFVVNARTGAIIWQAEHDTVSGMDYSMPGNAVAIDRDRDGVLDRVYQADTGGQIWRLDMRDSDTANWNLVRLATVGSDQTFLAEVDVVSGSDGNGPFDAVLIGSGDREDPFDTSVTNRFYMFKDRIGKTPNEDGRAYPIDFSQLFNATSNTIQDGDETAIKDLEDSRGWYINLNNAGEKVVGGATTLNGTTFFNTMQPPDPNSDSCENLLGTARNYAVSYLDATATLEQDEESGLTTDDRSDTTPGGGFPPSPVPVIVSINDKQYLAVISGTTVKTVPNIPLGVRERVYWFKENLDSGG